MKIESIDGKFALETTVTRPGLVFKDVLEEPFKIYGLMRENGHFVRMPQEIANTVNGGVAEHNVCTAGGRVRYVTDSPYVAVAVKYNVMRKLRHFAYSGSIGMDVYCDDGEGDVYIGTYMPDGESDVFEAAMDFPPHDGLRTVTIHFPLYSGVDELMIGYQEGSNLSPAPEYDIADPIVFYGSSITQGGCVSRPGNAYENLLSRLLSCDHVNLGFAGSAFGEESMARYLASLNMSAFILDYDHNAPTAEHLEKTHEPMFRAVREAHPDVPIIMLSRPMYHLDEDCRRRVEIIRRTYEKAVAAGDRKVCFIPGPDLIEERLREVATVDNCHPNDCGFVSMAYALLEPLKKFLKQ